MTELFDLISTYQRLQAKGGGISAYAPYPAEIVELTVLPIRSAIHPCAGYLPSGSYRYAAVAFSGDGQCAAQRETNCWCSIIEGEKPCFEAYTTDLNTVGFGIYRKTNSEESAWLFVGIFMGRHVTFEDDGKTHGETHIETHGQLQNEAFSGDAILRAMIAASSNSDLTAFTSPTAGREGLLYDLAIQELGVRSQCQKTALAPDGKENR